MVGSSLPCCLMGKYRKQRKEQGDVDTGFSPPTKTRWKLHVEKENWDPEFVLV